MMKGHLKLLCSCLLFFLFRHQEHSSTVVWERRSIPLAPITRF